MASTATLFKVHYKIRTYSEMLFSLGASLDGRAMARSTAAGRFCWGQDMSCITDWLLIRDGCIREKFIIYKQACTQTHTSQTSKPQAILPHACNQSKGPHRHVLDKDRQIRRQRLRLTTALALITGWPAMKETDDMCLFVFSSIALNQVNIAIPVKNRW